MARRRAPYVFSHPLMVKLVIGVAFECELRARVPTQLVVFPPSALCEPSLRLLLRQWRKERASSHRLEVFDELRKRIVSVRSETFDLERRQFGSIAPARTGQAAPDFDEVGIYAQASACSL
jgi:hypothetical protein